MAMSADENDNIYLKGNYEKVKYNITFERYGDNTFGKDGSERFENIVKTIPYGTWVDNNYIHNVLGISSEFKVAGGRVYIDSADDIVKLVDPRPEESRVLNTTYSFTYAGNNDKVRSVTYSVDGGESHELLLNETIHVNPGRNLLNYDTVTFTVKVADGEELQLDCPGRRNEITKLDNNTYQFAITVNGYNHDKQAHFDFYLK